jgi:two-component system response regulator YesN
MKERSYKISVGSVALTATYFSNELGDGRREPLGEIFDNLSNVHRHAEHEIFFLWDGEMELVTENGNLHFSDSAVIVPPDVGHYTVIDAEKLFVIYLRIDRAEGEAERSLAKRLSEGVLSLGINSDEKFYIEKIFGAKNSADISHLLSLLFSDVFLRLEPGIFAAENDVSSTGKYAFALENYVGEHYNGVMRLSDVAEHLHLCEKQVLRVIKKEYGCSFSDYVNQKSMSVAIMMLKHTSLTVNEIARRVGFENDNYFYRVFKKKYGETPTEYRNKHKNTLE